MCKKIMTPKNKTSSISLFGNFAMTVYETKNKQKVRICNIIKKNQITNSGRNALLNLMYAGSIGSTQELYRIWSLSVGINNTPPSISDDLGTMTPVWNSKFVAGTECIIVESPPNSYYLQIVKSMSDTDAVGYTLTEAGIFTRGDDDDPNVSSTKLLYARQIFPPVIKTNTMTIEFDWQLGITIQGY